MVRLFLGLVFVILDYKVTIGTAAVEILPDFAGFFLLMRSMEHMASDSRHFDRGRHWAFVMTVLSAVLFGADLLNPGTHEKVWLWAAEMAVLAVRLGLVRSVILGLEDSGKDVQLIRGMFPVLTVLQLLCCLASWIPLVGKVCGLVSLATGVLFLTIVYKEMWKK